MKIKFKTLLLLLMTFSACGGRTLSQKGIPGQPEQQPQLQPAAMSLWQSQTVHLDDFAQLERSGTWLQGMGFTESGIRENAGDYAGAVTAAYKELSWMYGMGLIEKEEIEQALWNVLVIKNDKDVTSAVNAVLAFLNGNWNEAAAGIEAFIDEQEEPDSFNRWMLLACTLENDNDNRRAVSAYQSIRARYTLYPEYWYRGARAFYGFAAAEFAENCINASPEGPFAGECRNILAVYTGLRNEDGYSIKTKTEIETIITNSIRTGDPGLLDPLLPLIGLPDNPYTVYAIGALKALNTVPVYRDYFNEKAAVSRGRLSERLVYISRS